MSGMGGLPCMWLAVRSLGRGCSLQPRVSLFPHPWACQPQEEPRVCAGCWDLEGEGAKMSQGQNASWSRILIINTELCSIMLRIGQLQRSQQTPQMGGLNDRI